MKNKMIVGLLLITSFICVGCYSRKDEEKVNEINASMELIDKYESDDGDGTLIYRDKANKKIIVIHNIPGKGTVISEIEDKTIIDDYPFYINEY